MADRRSLPNGDIRTLPNGDVRILPGGAVVDQTISVVRAILRVGQQYADTARVGQQAQQELKI